MRAPSPLDLAGLRCWLDAEHPGLLAGPLTATALPGGRSNLTFLVESPHTQVVLRRPPLGEHPSTAHDMAREFRIITALAPTPVPVPAGLLLCEDTDAIGAPFYLMRYVDGLVLRSRAEVAPYDAAAKRDLAERLVDGLAQIHAVDLEATGLADLGRPDGYLERQVARWRRHLDVWGSANRDRLHSIAERLASDMPTTGRNTLVHGDFRLDNIIVDRDLALLAVLDWEMATIGDPLADLGLFLVYWDLAGETTGALSTAMGPAAGFPPGPDLARWYAERTGAGIEALDWYVALAAFKLAVVLEGVRQRQSEHPVPGQTSVEQLIPVLADYADRRL